MIKFIIGVSAILLGAVVFIALFIEVEDTPSFFEKEKSVAIAMSLGVVGLVGSGIYLIKKK